MKKVIFNFVNRTFAQYHEAYRKLKKRYVTVALIAISGAKGLYNGTFRCTGLILK